MNKMGPYFVPKVLLLILATVFPTAIEAQSNIDNSFKDSVTTINGWSLVRSPEDIVKGDSLEEWAVEASNDINSGGYYPGPLFPLTPSTVPPVSIMPPSTNVNPPPIVIPPLSGVQPSTDVILPPIVSPPHSGVPPTTDAIPTPIVTPPIRGVPPSTDVIPPPINVVPPTTNIPPITTVSPVSSILPPTINLGATTKGVTVTGKVWCSKTGSPCYECAPLNGARVILVYKAEEISSTIVANDANFNLKVDNVNGVVGAFADISQMIVRVLLPVAECLASATVSDEVLEGNPQIRSVAENGTVLQLEVKVFRRVQVKKTKSK